LLQSTSTCALFVSRFRDNWCESRKWWLAKVSKCVEHIVGLRNCGNNQVSLLTNKNNVIHMYWKWKLCFWTSRRCKT